MSATMIEPQMPPEIYEKLRAQSLRDRSDLGAALRAWNADQITEDIFPINDELEKQRAAVNAAQEKLTAVETSARESALEYASLCRRRDSLARKIADVENQQASLTQSVKSLIVLIEGFFFAENHEILNVGEPTKNLLACERLLELLDAFLPPRRVELDDLTAEIAAFRRVHKIAA